MGNGCEARIQEKEKTEISAVQLNLETDGFSYAKWGGTQRCKQGDWLVDNDGDTYTVDEDVFERTYKKVSPARYVKVTSVWAEEAETEGVIQTKEGETQYKSGDYLVYNEQDGGDGYAVSAGKFEEMYEKVE